MSSSARKCSKQLWPPKLYVEWRSVWVFYWCRNLSKNFHEVTALVFGSYQFMGRFFLLMQQETMCFLPCQIYLLYSLVELLLFMIFQIYLVSEARILTLAYASMYTYRAEIKQLSNWVVSHCCFALNWEPSCISDSHQKLIQNQLCMLLFCNKLIGNSEWEYNHDQQ